MTLQNICSTLLCGLRMFAGPPIFRLPDNVIFAADGLSILTCSPNMSFLAWLVSDNSRRLETFELGHSQENNFCTWSEFLFIATWRVRCDLLGSINFRVINDSLKLGPKNLYEESTWSFRSGTIGFNWCDFLLVINCTRVRILHRFRDAQQRYIWLPLLRLTPDGRASLGRSPYTFARRLDYG